MIEPPPAASPQATRTLREPELRAADEHDLAGLLGRKGSLEELEAHLADQIREGDIDDRWGQVLAVLRASARRHLRIANPEYVRLED